MNSCIKAQISIFIFIFLNSGCITYEFFTIQNTAYDSVCYSNNIYISSEEVTIREWVTYIAFAKFEDYEKSDTLGESKYIFYLGDSINCIKQLLPDLKIHGWCSYVINSFLREDEKISVQHVYDHCTGKSLGITLPKTASDSILKYNLLDLPVVGITYEQALKFVEYKQKISNSYISSKKKSMNKYRYECFLPSPAQFDSAQTRMDTIIVSLKCQQFNYKHDFCPDCPYSKKYINHPVLKNIGKEPIYARSYFPNDYGIFNFKGNIAEMTSVKGIAKGGSCCHYGSEAYPDKFQAYTKPEIWLGLRVWFRYY